MRLIDADALMKIIRTYDYPLKSHTNSTGNGMFTIGIQQAVNEQQTIDAVEVVRCKDCKWLKTEHCPFRIGGLFIDSYCSFGERKTDE